MWLAQTSVALRGESVAGKLQTKRAGTEAKPVVNEMNVEATITSIEICHSTFLERLWGEAIRKEGKS